MKQNIGSPDRIIRLILGGLLLGAAVTTQSVLIAIAGIFSLYESLVGWCAFYQLIGRNTCPIRHKATASKQHIPLFTYYCSGLSILVVAIILNLTATRIGVLTWYDFLRIAAERGFVATAFSTSPDTLLFLFCLYPLLLGTTGQITARWVNRYIANKKADNT